MSFMKMHSDFLRTLRCCQPVDKPGTTIVDGVAAKWESIVSRLGVKWHSLGREVLRRASDKLSKLTVACGIMHGDFTPWHTRVHGGGVSLFDWESASWETPASWDRLHFLAQTECLLNRKHGNGTANEYTDGDQACNLLYLLHSTAQLVEEKADLVGINYREKQILRHLSFAAGT